MVRGSLPLAQAWTVEMALHYFAAPLFAHLFLREFQCGEIAALLAGVGGRSVITSFSSHGHPHSAVAAPHEEREFGLDDGTG
jgi:hypothetical protein